MHELKKQPFSANQKFSIYRKLYGLHSKPFLRTKFLLHVPFFAVRKKIPIFTNQKVFFCRKLYAFPSKAAFFTYKKPFIRTNLSLFPPKITLFCPPPPLPTTLNLLFAKNTAVLLLFALILCCKAGASHRFKSLPAIPGEVAAFHKTGYLMMAAYFSENHVSTGDLNRPRSPEVRKPLVYFWFFSYTRKE